MAYPLNPRAGIGNVIRVSGLIRSWSEGGYNFTVSRDSRGKPLLVSGTAGAESLSAQFTYASDGLFQATKGDQISSVMMYQLGVEAIQGSLVSAETNDVTQVRKFFASGVKINLADKYSGSLVDGYPLVWGRQTCTTIFQGVGTACSRVSPADSTKTIYGMSLKSNASVTNSMFDFTLESARTLSTGNLGFLYYLADMDAETSIDLAFYVADGAGFSNYFSENYVSFQPGWYWVPISKDATGSKWVAGGAGGTAEFGTTVFDRMRIKQTHTSGKRPTIEFYGLFERPRTTKSQIAFTIDDGLASVYTLGAASFEKYRIPMTCCLIADKIDTPGMMTLAQVKDLVLRGHEMVAHGVSGTKNNLNDFVGPTRAADVYAELCYQRDYLVSNGLAKNGSEKMYVYPQGIAVFDGDGSGNTEIRQALQAAGFLAARGTDYIHNDIVPHSIGSQASKWYLESAGHVWVSSGTEAANIANIIARIKDAAAQGKHVMVMLHKFVSGAAAAGVEIQVSNLELILAATAQLIADGTLHAGTMTSIYNSLT